jgi:hypothetical protein
MLAHPSLATQQRHFLSVTAHWQNQRPQSVQGLPYLTARISEN